MINIVPLVGLREQDQLKQNAAIQAIARCFSNGQIREVLTVARTYYVRVSGSGGADTNDGLSTSTPFLTVSKAFSAISALDTGGQNVTIDVGAGTFHGGTVNGPWMGNGTVALQGAGAASTTIDTTIALTFGAILSVSGVTITVSSGNGINVTDGSTLRLTSTAGNVIFGAVTGGGGHMQSSRSSHIRIEGSTNYTITGNAAYHIQASNNGSIVYFSPVGTITLSGTPAFASGFYVGQLNGSCNWNNMAFSGTGTGRDVGLDTNASIKNFGTRFTTAGFTATPPFEGSKLA